MKLIPQRSHTGEPTGLFFVGKLGPISLKKARKIVRLMRLLDEIEAAEGQAPQAAAVAPVTPDLMRSMLLMWSAAGYAEEFLTLIQQIIFDLAAKNGVDNNHKEEVQNHDKPAKAPKKSSFTP